MEVVLEAKPSTNKKEVAQPSKKEKDKKQVELRLAMGFINSNPLFHVPEFPIRKVHTYDPLFPMNNVLWKVYKQWEQSKPMNDDKQTVGYMFRKKDFFKILQRNT